MSGSGNVGDSTSGYDFSWSNAAEQSIAGVLGSVPDVGPLLSALVYIFWPQSGTDVWAGIEQEVEQLIQQDLDKLVQEQVTASLQGLNSNLSSYLTALSDGTGDPTYISEKWNVANGDFLQQLPTFQLPNYQLLLLPLFAQFANLHLSLLRDGVVGGANWGWTPEIIAQTQTELTNAIASYQAYVPPIYEQALANLQKRTKGNDHEAEPFRTVNAFVRQMTLTVLDFMNLWQYFDVSKYPGAVAVALDREIYSDPLGTCDNSGNIVLPAPPTQPISEITVWGWDRIDAVQLTYPAGGGPDGVTTTARMGDQNGGSSAPPYGGVFNVTSNPVTTAIAGTGDIVNYMYLGFADGTYSGKLGGRIGGGPNTRWSFPGEILSSIHINGISDYYLSADCVVFGFKYQTATPVNDAIKQVLYVSAPTEPADVTPSDAAEWQTARAAYWDALRARAKG